jgi:hypothetical protein
MRPGCPQPGQARQKPGSVRVQVAHSGASRVPPRMGWTWPQLEQLAQRCLQAAQEGCPVAVEMLHGTWRPQMAQVITATGRQA